MRVPEWKRQSYVDANDEKQKNFVRLDERDDWTSRSAVLIDCWTSIGALKLAASLHNVRHIRIDFQHCHAFQREAAFSLLLKVEAPHQLWCLELTSFHPDEGEVTAFAAALRRQRQIKQLRIVAQGDVQLASKAAFAQLFDAMSCLQFQALCFVSDSDSKGSGEFMTRFMREFLPKQTSLRSLELHGSSFEKTLDGSFVCPSWLELAYYRMSRSMMENLRRTTQLRYLELRLEFPTTEESMAPFVALAEEGWLLQIQCTGQLDPRISQLLQRNAIRHQRCVKACLYTIAIRKSKRGLSQFPKDVILMIAKLIWETRNQEAWDDARESKRRK